VARYIETEAGGQRMVMDPFFVERRGVIHDLTAGVEPPARYAVLGGAKLGVDIISFGIGYLHYFGSPPIIFGDKATALQRAEYIAGTPLQDAVLGEVREDYPFDDTDYRNLGRRWFSRQTVPPPQIHSSAIVAAMQPGWEQSSYSLPLREALAPASLEALGALISVNFVVADNQRQ